LRRGLLRMKDGGKSRESWKSDILSRRQARVGRSGMTGADTGGRGHGHALSGRCGNPGRGTVVCLGRAWRRAPDRAGPGFRPRPCMAVNLPGGPALRPNPELSP
jgi:hypothetical protein